ncbi:MAG: lyase family protein, partial [Pseudonocardia sp.]
METEYRIEHDTMGEVRVPVDALWGAQTQRAVQNFPISGRGLERAQIRALGLVKGAAARVNKRIGVLPAELSDAIAIAADEIAAGRHDAHFPVDVFQTGSGTSSNMNANEVIATLAGHAAGSQVHPNDHVNASQSSNDVFPTTIHLAATEALATDVIPALEHLGSTLRRRAADWSEVVKAGRTHLMDAVPITLGQEAGAWATQAEYGAARLRDVLPRLGQLP